MTNKLIKIAVIMFFSACLTLFIGSMPVSKNKSDNNVNPEINKLRTHNINSENLSNSALQQKNPLILLELTVD